ncbi:helix-turn-helix domain-containing protein [bacterium]|nr:helix-turn-helix domain-containing protein [bacterium]
MSKNKFNFEEACIYLNLKKNTLYKYVADGKIPCHKEGKNLYFIKTELDSCRSSQEITSKTLSFLKDCVHYIKSFIKLFYRLAKDKTISPAARITAGVAALYIITPVDLIFDGLPFIGYFDDLLFSSLAIGILLGAAGKGKIIGHWKDITGEDSEKFDILIFNIECSGKSYMKSIRKYEKLKAIFKKNLEKGSLIDNSQENHIKGWCDEDEKSA